MARFITIASAKGGVGKTTFVSNLATALAQQGKRVIAIDSNLTTSNLGLHLGIPLYPHTLQDVLKGRISPGKALYTHSAGFRVLPADISMRQIMVPRASRLLNVLSRLDQADFVLIDAAAGLGREALAAVEAGDELITVTTPELPALTDALKVIKFADRFSTINLGVVINRVAKERHEYSQEEVEEFLGVPVISSIPEDPAVRRAIANKTPVVLYHPHAKASRRYHHIATQLTGVPATLPSGFSRLVSWLRY
ncbi:MAG: cell division ATPase MinD [Nanoarchaeota archaeon]|nr:cell division ATPase MinD [Nanoarchaeota archaeon]